MLINEKILACRISEVASDCFKVIFIDGTTKTCYFEDLPYLETGKNLHVGDIIKVRINGNDIIPLLPRPRSGSTATSHFDSRRLKKIDLMNSFSYEPIKKQLSRQIKQELERQLKELKND